MNIRSARELRTIAEAVDMILKGNVVGAADVLIQRFKAVESTTGDVGWNVARHHEIIPEGRVSIVSQSERELVASREKEELKLGQLIKGARPG